MIYRVRVPFAGEWLTANVERHRYNRAANVAAWRHAVVGACTGARMPKGITPVHIDAVVCYGGCHAPVKDRLNLAPTMKAIVDGLCPSRTFTRKIAGTEQKKTYRTAGYGLLPDDNDQHVLSTNWTLTPSGSHRAWVDLTITHEPTTVDNPVEGAAA